MSKANSFVVHSDPASELPVKNAKYVKTCTSLYLGNKDIEQLTGFERFSNLEVVWLNDNVLRKINNLDNNFRLKSLYAQNNEITTVEGSIVHFKFLENLHLFNNKISDLDKTLSVLSRLNHLRTLELFDNPCAQEEHYRLRVIHAMPAALRVLDRRAIKQEERNLAAKMFRMRRKGLPFEMPPSITTFKDPASLVGPLSGCTMLLFSEVENIMDSLDKEALTERPEIDEVALEYNQSVPMPSFWVQSPLGAKQDTLTEWQTYEIQKAFRSYVGEKTHLDKTQAEDCIRALESTVGHSLLDRYTFIEELADSCNLDSYSESGSQDGVIRIGTENMLQALRKAKWQPWDRKSYLARSNEHFDAAHKHHARLTMHKNDDRENSRTPPEGKGKNARAVQQDKTEKPNEREKLLKSVCKEAIVANRFGSLAFVERDTETLNPGGHNKPKFGGTSEDMTRGDVFLQFSLKPDRKLVAAGVDVLASPIKSQNPLPFSPTRLKKFRERTKRQRDQKSRLILTRSAHTLF